VERKVWGFPRTWFGRSDEAMLLRTTHGCRDCVFEDRSRCWVVVWIASISSSRQYDPFHDSPSFCTVHCVAHSKAFPAGTGLVNPHKHSFAASPAILMSSPVLSESRRLPFLFQGFVAFSVTIWE
jgi:hypothetical protein